MKTSAAPNPWLNLAVGATTLLASSFVVSGAAFLIPALISERGLTLTQAGTIAAMPLIGTMLTLLAWGVLVDRIGERAVLSSGLALATLTGTGAVLADSSLWLGIFLLLGGMTTAGTNSATGRLIVGSFPSHRRGLAMGIRQTAQPIAVGLAAVTIPVVAHEYGLRSALTLALGICAVSGVAAFLLIVDPPRPSREEAHALGHLTNPYRRVRSLWRIHAASVLLVIPQFAVWTFALVWLIAERDWSPASAGLLVAFTQLLGAASRIGAGHWSDRIGSRLRPMRLVAVAAAFAMIGLGLFEDTRMAVALLIVASVVSVVDNGLAYTAVAEASGPFWSGRTLGIHNTAQFLASASVPPLLGAVISHQGYGFAFAIVAVFPLLAVPLVPVNKEAQFEPSPAS